MGGSWRGTSCVTAQRDECPPEVSIRATQQSPALGDAGPEHCGAVLASQAASQEAKGALQAVVPCSSGFQQCLQCPRSLRLCPAALLASSPHPCFFCHHRAFAHDTPVACGGQSSSCSPPRVSWRPYPQERVPSATSATVPTDVGSLSPPGQGCMCVPLPGPAFIRRS